MNMNGDMIFFIMYGGRMRHALKYDITADLTLVQRRLYFNWKYGLPFQAEFINSRFQLQYHNYHITKL